MRQTQRMQIGIALAAGLFCLTSVVTGHDRGSEPLVHPQSRLMSVCHVNFADDAKLEVYRDPRRTTPNAVLLPSNDAFQQITQGLNNAPVTDAVNQGAASSAASPGLRQTLVLYEQSGRVDRVLYVTNTGLLYDVERNRFFQPDAHILEFLSSTPEVR